MSFQTSGPITVSTGATRINLPSGTTIADVRIKLGLVTNVANDATAYKGTEALSEQYVTQPGDNINFSKKTGEKGS